MSEAPPTGTPRGPLAPYELSLTLRYFQQQAFDATFAAFRRGDRNVHVVAPPGAGKTILGLAIACEYGARTVVLSPTSTIAKQWADKATKHLSDVEGFAEVDTTPLVGDELDPMPAILSTTYQAFSVKGNEGDLHDNVHDLFARLVETGANLLLLDECHHIKNHWAVAIRHFLKQAPDVRVIGLTATPPIDASRDELERHMGILGEVTYEIPLPALVRDGWLCPYQDLAFMVQPTQRELDFLAGAHERFHRLTHELREPGDVLASWPFWIGLELEREAGGEGKYDHWGAYLTEAPDDAIALVRVAQELGVPLPPEAWTIAEMDEPPDLDDYARSLDAYATHYLRALRDEDTHPLDDREVFADEKVAAEALWNELKEALSAVGYLLTRNGIRKRASSIDRLLGLSAAKYGALQRVLHAELDALGDGLRAVIVTDFERATRSKAVKELEGVLDPEAGGAISVLRYLVADERLKDLDAVMVTGKSLVADSDMVGMIIAALEQGVQDHEWRISWEVEYDGPLALINGRGSDWHSSTYTLLVTELFEQGVTRCMVGTRGLLGEGWDAKSANVLVDLTSVSAFVSTNQLRGRCLRLDPNAPNKVSNLWDIVAIAPHLERGFADWDRLVRKHGHVYGLADDGEIERGVGHVHPTLTHIAEEKLASIIEPLNQDMLRRADARMDARELWKIGEPYNNASLASVELRNRMQEPLATHAPGVSRKAAARYAGEHRAWEAERTRLHEEIANTHAQAQFQRQQAQQRRAAIEAELHRREAAARNDTALVHQNKRRQELSIFLPGLLFSAAAFVAVGPAALVAGIALSLVGASAYPGYLRNKAAEREQAELRRLAAERATADMQLASTLANVDLWASNRETEIWEAIAQGKTHIETRRIELSRPMSDGDTVRLFAGIVLDAFRRWDETQDAWLGAEVRTTLRVDGTVSVQVTQIDATNTQTFAQAFEELIGPLANPRYLLVCPKLTFDAEFERILAGRSDDAEELDESRVAYIPVPEPFSNRRSGADAFAAAWSAALGPCEVLYTRRGEGAELLSRHMRDRWMAAKTRKRTVWG